MSNHADLVAAFLARGGAVKKIESGVQTLDKREIRALSGYEPDSLIKFDLYMIGEDGKEFAIAISAANKPAAIAKARLAYPESQVSEILHQGERADRLYMQTLECE